MEEEKWAPIPGFFDRYWVSSLGRIKSIIEGKENFLKQPINHKGYPTIGFRIPGGGRKRYTFRTHRLVAMAFIPNPHEKPQVNHKNMIKTDNSVDNLEWSTNKENADHAHGIRGATSAKLSHAEVAKIRKEYVPRKVTLEFLSKKYGVSQAALSLLINKKTWSGDHIQ